MFPGSSACSPGKEAECGRAGLRGTEARARAACLEERAWVQRGAGAEACPFFLVILFICLHCRKNKEKKRNRNLLKKM